MPQVEDEVKFPDLHTLSRGEGGMRVLLPVVYHRPAPPIIEEPTLGEGFSDRNALARPP